MNREELEEYMNAYGKDLYSFCCFLTQKRQKADDLYQDTFLKLYESKESLLLHNPKSYLMSVAVNLYRNIFRIIKENENMEKENRLFRRKFPAVILAAVLVLAFGSITAMAAYHYLSPANVAVSSYINIYSSRSIRPSTIAFCTHNCKESIAMEICDN